MKKIVLKENELKSLIYECVYKVLHETQLFEYLIYRNDFTKMCWNLSHQILENWCLVHYCTLVGRTELKEHWKDELLSYLDRIDRNGIKSNNSPKSREKAIRQGFDMADLFDVNSKIYKYVWKKFEKEQIFDKEIVQQVIIDFHNSLDDIVNILSNESDIEGYVDTI